MQNLGPYTILELLGRGGQGVVYLAEDTRLKRRVALKVLKGDGLAADRGELERFRREAEAASKLDHPHICGIHEAGEADGVPYIAMRFVEGETLADVIATAQQADASGAESTPRSRDEIHAILHRIEKVARALHVAHERGLIHRDIKPGNIMVTAEGEPIVLDFGLARDDEADDHSLTQSGDLLGTPAYMSPEQLMAQRIPLDRRTDVYSLGATLYEALTLHRPFVATTRAELYQKILSTEPSSAGSQNRQIPPDLQIVLETAMEKDRNRRYQTASDFAEDLRRVRAFEAVHARPISRLLRLRRWAQRHPALASSSVLVVLALTVTVLLLADTRASLRHSEMLRLVGESAEAGGRDPVGALRSALAAVDLEHSPESVDQVRNVLALTMPSASVMEAQGSGCLLRVAADQRHVMQVGEGRMKLFAADGRTVTAVDVGRPAAWGFSPTGAYAVLRQKDGEIRLWSTANGRAIPLEILGGKIAEHAWTADDRLVLAHVDDDAVLVAHPDTGAITVIRSADGGPVVTNLAVDDTRGLIVFGRRQVVERWALDGSAEPQVVALPAAPRRLAVSADSGCVATVLADGSLMFCDFGAASARFAAASNSGAVDVRVSPTGSRFVSYHSAEPARLWDANGGAVATLERPDRPRLPALVPGPRGYVTSEPFSSDGRRLALLYRDLTLCIWDDAGRCIRSAVGSPGSSIKIVEWSPQADRLVYGTALHVLVLDPDGRLQHDLPLARLVRGFSDLGSTLWTSSARGFVRWHDSSLPRHAHQSTVQHIYRQDEQLMTGGDDGRLLRFGTDGTLLQEYGPLEDAVKCVALSRDGRWIAVGTDSGSLQLWASSGDRPTAEWTATTPQSFKGIEFLSVDPPRFVATGWHTDAYVCELGRPQTMRFPLGARGGGDIVVRDGVVLNGIARFGAPSGKMPAGVLIWRPDGGVIQELRIPGSDTAEAISCSADGLLLAASAEANIYVWRRAAASECWQEPAQVLEGHTGFVWCLDLSADGTRLVSCSNDGTARLWTLEDGRCTGILRGHDGAVRSVTFLPGDREVMTGGEDGYLRRFVVDEDEVLELARQRAAALTEPR